MPVIHFFAKSDKVFQQSCAALIYRIFDGGKYTNSQQSTQSTLNPSGAKYR